MIFQDKEGTEWKEMQLSSNADSVSLQDLSFGSDYQLEVTAVNANGSSLPAMFNFTIADPPGMWPLTPYTIHFSLLARKCGLNYKLGVLTQTFKYYGVTDSLTLVCLPRLFISPRSQNE